MMKSRLPARPPIAASAGPATSDVSSEPATKRIRLDRTPNHIDSRFTDCLRRQVFPHVDLQLSTLHKNRVNTLKVGRQVVANLTGHEFAEQYKLGNGTISPEFEARLAARAALEVRALSRHPDYQLAPSSASPPTTTPRPRIETPIPVPQLPFLSRPGFNRTPSETPISLPKHPSACQSDVTRPAPPASAPPRISSSPIPLPTIPHGLPTRVNGTSNGTHLEPQSSSAATPANPFKAPQARPFRASQEVIVVEDDDDEVAIEKAVPVRQPVVKQPLAPPAKTIPRPLRSRPLSPKRIKAKSRSPAPTPKTATPPAITTSSIPAPAASSPPTTSSKPIIPNATVVSLAAIVSPVPSIPSPSVVWLEPVPSSAPDSSSQPVVSHASVVSSVPAVFPTPLHYLEPVVPSGPVLFPTIIGSSAPDASSAPATATSSSTKSRARENKQQDARRQAHALIQRGKRAALGEDAKPVSKWFSEPRRPYLTAAQRTSIVGGAQGHVHLGPHELAMPVTIHVDFGSEEIRYLRTLARKTLKLSTEKGAKDPKRDLGRVLKKNPDYITSVLDAFSREKSLPWRSRIDVDNFFQDLVCQKTRTDPAIFTIARDEADRRGELLRASRVHSLLLAREVAGQRGIGSMRCIEQFNNEFRKCREDALEKKAEWTGCAGDIFTITWVSNDGFICGTTEHSDSHNQQYNKPGNLVLGSCSEVKLRAYPEHRVVRPVVEKGENSTDAMRQSQDPWLYSSVVSSDYDAVHDRAFTCSFDRTVKIWKVEKSGVSMSLLGEWKHDGNVNFVAASKHVSGMVATAADVAAEAVRIYSIDASNPSGSPFRPFSCSRVTDERGNTVSTEKWAYYPATMQWGVSETVRHLLLVGYSPRSRTGDDNDIPEERRDSGELCLWDGITGERWRVTSATTQNVFEVLWHPSQPSFIAATSPLGLDLEPSVRTQIRIFRPADNREYGSKAFSPVITLDCTAVDINELTIMPNSFSYSYVTAGCTDGNTYVWDTARGDKPIHTLRHGEPIDEYRGDREREDVGVKFTAWGNTPDRFYTGSSDGVVKVWNVRSLERPLVRNLLEAPAPITAGMFCPDKSRLVVGDASGRVFMLSVDEEKEQPTLTMRIPDPGSKTGFKTVQRPPAIIPHADPPPPTHDAQGNPILAETGPSIGRAYLNQGHLERHLNPTIGVVQGPRYAETNLFRREMHFNEDPAQPLLARWEAQQQEARKPAGSRPSVMSKKKMQAMVLRPLKEMEGLGEMHERNTKVNLDVERLEEEVRRELERDGVDWELMGEVVLGAQGEDGDGEEWI
ncbi:hypothetical protein VTI74DRAFT_8208 [Chaetomium olivicolor]